MPLSEADQILLTENIAGEAEGFGRKLARTLGNLRSSGVSQPQIRVSILDELTDGRGSLSSLMGLLKSESELVQQRFYNDGIQAEVLGNDDPEKKLFMWSAIGKDTCPSCTKRHGNIKTWAEWDAIGRPGFGTTVCTFHCRCVLIPIDKAKFLYRAKSDKDLTKRARDPIVQRHKEIQAEAKRRGEPFAESTFNSKLGQFRNKSIREDVEKGP